MPMIVTPRASHCFSSLIWLSRNISVQKSRFSRIVRNSREFSLLDLELEAFCFHFSLLEKEWKHFIFTLHFSKKSESIFFSLCTSRKRVKAFCFHFSLLELQKPTLAGPWLIYVVCSLPGPSLPCIFRPLPHSLRFWPCPSLPRPMKKSFPVHPWWQHRLLQQCPSKKRPCHSLLLVFFWHHQPSAPR